MSRHHNALDGMPEEDIYDNCPTVYWNSPDGEPLPEDYRQRLDEAITYYFEHLDVLMPPPEYIRRGEHLGVGDPRVSEIEKRFEIDLSYFFERLGEIRNVVVETGVLPFAANLRIEPDNFQELCAATQERVYSRFIIGEYGFQTKRPPLSTKDGVVQDILGNLTNREKVKMRNTPEHELMRISQHWRGYLKKYYQMDRNEELLRHTGTDNPGAALTIIVKEVWRKLQTVFDSTSGTGVEWQYTNRRSTDKAIAYYFQHRTAPISDDWPIRYDPLIGELSERFGVRLADFIQRLQELHPIVERTGTLPFASDLSVHPHDILKLWDVLILMQDAYGG